MKRRAFAGFSWGILNGVLAFGCSNVAMAQPEWPGAQPIRLMVGFASGGPTDVVARVIAQRLGTQLGTSVVVINRPGANGNIAADQVVKSKPDGFTFLYNSSSLTLSPSIYKQVPFDLSKDFAYVAGTVAMPSVLVVRGDLPVKDFPEWLKYVQSQGSKVNYGSPGTGNSAHLATEVILKTFNATATHVPYKGSSEARTALLAGDTQFQVDSMNSVLPLIKSGRLRAIAVLSAKRSVDLPDTPTIAESGIPGFAIDTWQGVAAPANTPAAIVNRMSTELARAIASPEVGTILREQGAFSISSKPEEYANFVQQESARFAKIVRDLGLTPKD